MLVRWPCLRCRCRCGEKWRRATALSINRGRQDVQRGHSLQRNLRAVPRVRRASDRIESIWGTITADGAVRLIEFNFKPTLRGRVISLIEKGPRKHPYASGPSARLGGPFGTACQVFLGRAWAISGRIQGPKLTNSARQKLSAIELDSGRHVWIEAAYRPAP